MHFKYLVITCAITPNFKKEKRYLALLITDVITAACSIYSISGESPNHNKTSRGRRKLSVNYLKYCGHQAEVGLDFFVIRTSTCMDCISVFFLNYMKRETALFK